MTSNIREQHAELVRAEACNRVSHAQGTSQPRFDLTKQLVPVSMSERVVDLLEAVEIDDEDTDAIAAPSCSEQRLPAPVEIQRAIGQPGQAVMQREILRLGRVPPQAFRRARDDREERGPQECNSG